GPSGPPTARTRAPGRSRSARYAAAACALVTTDQPSSLSPSSRRCVRAAAGERDALLVANTTGTWLGIIEFKPGTAPGTAFGPRYTTPSRSQITPRYRASTGWELSMRWSWLQHRH